MSDYEYVSPPEPITTECDCCGAESSYVPELPRLGPMTLAEQRSSAAAQKAAEQMNSMYRALYADLPLVPDGTRMLSKIRMG